jgi:hypothetical protein
VISEILVSHRALSSISSRIRLATQSIFPWAVSEIALSFPRIDINIAVCSFILTEKPIILEIRSSDDWKG